jgi:hypothetical protein
MPATTLANQQSDAVLLQIHDGKLYRYMFSIGRNRELAYTRIREALVEKFGAPYDTKRPLNWDLWRRPGQSLMLDGLRGAVIVQDDALAEQAQKATTACLHSPRAARAGPQVVGIGAARRLFPPSRAG